MHRSPTALLRLLICATALLSPPALAQSPDEWSTIQPPPPQPEPAGAPAASTPPPASTPAPAEPLAPPPESAAADPLVTITATTADAAPPAVPEADALPGAAPEVKETFAPGTEPHSPGTAHNALGAPGNLRHGSGTVGATGLLRVGSADLGRPGVLRLSLFGEYFSGDDFPVLGANNTRTAGTLAIDYTFHRHAEAYLSYAASANSNNQTSPALMQSLGDIGLGIKGGLSVGAGLSLGADLRLEMFPGVGDQSLGSYAFGFAPRLLATWDAREVSPRVPLRVHLNAGVSLDNTDDLITSHPVTAVEEYALGINRYDRLGIGLGLEAPLPWITPFVEWGFAYPLQTADLVGPDGAAVTAFSTMTQQLTFGARVTAIRDLSFLVAVDLGLARHVALGIPATQPYNLTLGLTYHFDPTGRGETRLVERTQVVEKRVEVASAAPVVTGKVAGAVFDARTRAPLPGAIVTISDAGLPPVASDVDGGKFLTHELPAGTVRLGFAREGYLPASLEASVEAGQVTALEAYLEKEERGAMVKVALVSGRKRVAGKVSFTGPRAASLATAAEGTSQIELPKGRYAAQVEADGYLTKVKEFEVPEGGVVHLDIDVVRQPKVSLVVVKQDRIEIKQQVHFASGKATILADSHPLLEQVADAVLRSGVKKLRIEGHTDNRGGKEANLKLSQARAQAVIDHLVKNGIEASRFVAEGFGDSRPVAPNLTARGRELNRRVEFVILER